MTNSGAEAPFIAGRLQSQAKLLWKRGAIERGFGGDIADADLDQESAGFMQAAAEIIEGQVRRISILSEVIENAPHEGGCWARPQNNAGFEGYCTCWKSKALPAT